MPSDEDARRWVAWNLIQDDFAFAVRFGKSGERHPGVGWLGGFGMMPYIALHVYESYNYFQKTHPELAATLNFDHESVIKKSRHSVKFFDDKSADSTERIINYFQEGIVAGHAEHVSGSPYDLVLYNYSDSLVTTNHCANLGLGTEPADFWRSPDESKVSALTFQYGQYLISVLQGSWGPSESFLRFLEASQIHSSLVKSSEYYAFHFDSHPESATNGINGMLTTLQANLHFLKDLIAHDPVAVSRKAIFKLKLVASYHIVASAGYLLDHPVLELDPTSTAFLNRLRDGGSAPTLRSDSVRYLRNALVHYRPHIDFGVGDLMQKRPLYGLLEKYLPGTKFYQIDALVGAEIERTTNLMDEWSARDA